MTLAPWPTEATHPLGVQIRTWITAQSEEDPEYKFSYLYSPFQVWGRTRARLGMFICWSNAHAYPSCYDPDPSYCRCAGTVPGGWQTRCRPFILLRLKGSAAVRGRSYFTRHGNTCLLSSLGPCHHCCPGCGSRLRSRLRLTLAASKNDGHCTGAYINCQEVEAPASDDKARYICLWWCSHCLS